MKIRVLVKARSQQNKIEAIDDYLCAYISAIPHQGKANQALIGLLSDYFKIPKSKIKIIRGQNSRNKIIEVENGI